MTLLGFGKYESKSLELVLLKHPDYVAWMFEQKDPGGRLGQIRQEAREILRVFDGKPFVEKCFGRGCEKLAARCSLFKDKLREPYWWCDECDPYQTGAPPGRLAIASTYRQVLDHAAKYHYGGRAGYKKLIIGLARGRGFVEKVKDKHAKEFLKRDDLWGM